jgi:formylglycine-generating enzyme required for sulfatase activity
MFCSIRIFAIVLLSGCSWDFALGQAIQPSGPPVSTRLLLEMREAKTLQPFEEQAVRPLDMFKECDLCPEMIVIPVGEFIMGAPATEEDSVDDERPQHKVVFERPFAVGRFAVTFDEWDACVADKGCRGYRPPDRGWGRGRRPVINLWWEDAKSYVKWLSDKTNRTYRLLSEAEREYVTRAGTTTPFWWGDVLSTERANYDGTHVYPLNVGVRGQYREKSLPVDSFDPNPWGLYQVHGNIFEWVEDCWHPNYFGAPGDGSAWTAPDCSRHVMRGGSWNFPSWHVRAAARGAVGSAAAAMGLPPVGLRVARTLRR